MADRFPLILNTSNNQIQEIASGDNLDLTGTGINNAGIITASTFKGDGDFVELDVDGHTNLDNVSVAGVTTTTDHVRIDADNKKLQIGDGQDLELYHGGGHSYIANSTGEISILNTNGTVHIRGVSNEAGLEVTNNETVKLYGASNTLRLITSNTGVTVTGTVVADGADINGDLDVDGHTNLDNISVAGVSTFTGNADFSAGIDVTGNATVSGNLSVGGVLTYEDVTNVDSVGIVTAREGVFLPDLKQLKIGNTAGSPHLYLWHNSGTGNSNISNKTGDLFIQGNDGSGTVVNQIAVKSNAAVELNYQGGKRFETTGSGVNISGNLITNHSNGAIVNNGWGFLRQRFDTANYDSIKWQNAAASVDFCDIGYDIDTSTSPNSGILRLKGYGSKGRVLIIAGSVTIQFKEDREIAGVGNILPDTDSQYNIGSNAIRFANVYADTLYGDGSNLTGLVSVANQADNRLITATGTTDALNGEANLTWDDSAGLLTVRHGYSGGGGTGLRLYDDTSTGANEGMNIEWISGTDKTSDQCRIGQTSNATGSGSNLDFYTNAGDSGSSTRRLRITHNGKVGINQLDIDADLHVATAGSGEEDGTLKVGGNQDSLGLLFSYDQSGYTTTNITANPTYSSSGTIFKIRTNAGDNPNQLVLKGDSNIGIGTDNPQRMLNIVTRSSTAYSTTGYSSGGTTKLRIHNVEGTDNQGVGYHAGLEFVVSSGANSYGQLGYVRSGNNIGDFYFKHRTGGSSYAETTRIRHDGNLVNRGPIYGIWTESIKTPNGGSSLYDTQFIQDALGVWVVVGKITSATEMKGDMQSTRSLDTTTNQLTGDPKWSANWGDTYPSEVRYISASDWAYWRETRTIDFIHGVPDDRKWKNFFTSGQTSGMPVVGGGGNKQGWICAGAYDGFGRWRNPTFTNHKMADSGQGGPSISENFFTDDAQTMNWHSGNSDAKIHARHDAVSGGQDDQITTGYGWDDNVLMREDNFPNTVANGGGTDAGDYNLWICIKLSSPTFGHN